MKILIISYYYPPCNSIASLRTSSFVEFLNKNGVETKVITRHWKGNENTWKDYLTTNDSSFQKIKKSDLLEEIYIPYVRKKTNKIKNLISYIKGFPSLDIDISQFKKYIDKELNGWKPDFLFTSSPPLSLVNLTYWQGREFKLPYIIDFRDFENDFSLNLKSKHSLKRKLIFQIRVHLIKKALKKAHLISTSSPPFTEFFLKYNANSITVTNGYNPEEFLNFDESKTNEKFALSIIGTIYKIQPYKHLHKVFNQFLKGKDDICINFIGVKSNEIVCNEIINSLPNNKIKITDRLLRNEALEYMKKSDILFYYGWKGYKGVYSGKIFEYLGARKNILVYPSDNDVLENLIKQTNSGLITDNKNEVLDFLESKYNEWRINKKLSYYGKESEISKYSRPNQYLNIYKKLNDFKK